MAAAQPWTDAEDDRLRELAATGMSITKIAKAIGRHPSSVKRRLDKLGIHLDRTQTAAATQAKIIDAKARRAALEVSLLEDAEKMRARMFVPTTVYNFGGKDNTFNEAKVNEPPHADKLKLMQAAGIAIDRSLKIAEHDAASGHEEAASAAGDILAAIKAAAQASKGQDS